MHHSYTHVMTEWSPSRPNHTQPALKQTIPCQNKPCPPTNFLPGSTHCFQSPLIRQSPSSPPFLPLSSPFSSPPYRPAPRCTGLALSELRNGRHQWNRGVLLRNVPGIAFGGQSKGTGHHGVVTDKLLGETHPPRIYYFCSNTRLTQHVTCYQLPEKFKSETTTLGKKWSVIPNFKHLILDVAIHLLCSAQHCTEYLTWT